MPSEAAAACQASPSAARSMGRQRLTYILVRGLAHHYPSHHAALADRELMQGAAAGVRIVRALNCSKAEIPVFDAASEMFVVLRYVEEWLGRQEPSDLGADGITLGIEVARVLKRARRPITVMSARHGGVEGDPE